MATCRTWSCVGIINGYYSTTVALYLFLIPIQGMNEQNSDSFSPGITTTVPKMSELTTVATQKRRRFLDIFKKDTQKKERMVDPKIMNDNPSGQVLSSDGTLTSTTVIPESSPIVLVENSISHPVRAPFSERIS